MITSSVEIVLASLGFMISASAIKFQDEINALVKRGGAPGELNVTISSALAAFFFLGILIASCGVHGYRTRESGSSRWFYLCHFIFATLLSLCYFALFVESLVQFAKMNKHVESEEDRPIAQPQNATTTLSAVDEKEEKLDVKKVIDRLGFPTAICFIHIVLYIISGRFAYKAWRNVDNPTFQREILDEEPDEKQNPI